MNWTERLEELSQPQRRMVQLLNARVTMRRAMASDTFVRAGFAYLDKEDFLLQHGVWFEPSPWRMEWKQGVPKMCFGNALVLSVVNGLKYVEGMTLSPHHRQPIHHGWNTDDNGALVDSTWCNTGLAYLGVEFSVGRADTASWFDDGAVLENPASRYALFREPWNGEDYSLKWRKSPGMIQMEEARDGLIPGARRTLRTGVSREAKRVGVVPY